MWSIWNAPSDRDYYDPDGRWERQGDYEPDEEDLRCDDPNCMAYADQACERVCSTRQLISLEDQIAIPLSDLPRDQAH